MEIINNLELSHRFIALNKFSIPGDESGEPQKEILDDDYLYCSHYSMPLIKSRKSLELIYKYFSFIQSSVNISDLYTDAPDHQLEAVIMQNKKPIAFYSRKLNTAQSRYTTTERYRELLSAIET
jgi:hypothetical protein